MDTIASIKDLCGTVDVSRDGGDGGYTMCFGRNEDGTLANNSQRSIPKSTATVRTGLLDIDRYKQAVELQFPGRTPDRTVIGTGGAGGAAEIYSCQISRRNLVPD